MESITSLVLLVAVGSAVAAWVLASPRDAGMATRRDAGTTLTSRPVSCEPT
jgi:hypothetical protein